MLKILIIELFINETVDNNSQETNIKGHFVINKKYKYLYK